MPDVKFMHVVSYSSQDPKHPASNLIAQEAFRKWKGVAGMKTIIISGKRSPLVVSGQPTISVVLQLEKSCCIRALDIGNDFSAFIEVLVGRSADKEEEYQVGDRGNSHLLLCRLMRHLVNCVRT
jgi:DNA-repair protein XRCC1